MQPSDEIPPIDPATEEVVANKLEPKPGIPDQQSLTMAMLAHLLGALTGYQNKRAPRPGVRLLFPEH